ncbi:MAG: DUF4236 domain-containing protein [Limnohabitans sp.]|nr:DUF4236 domain-containing protein [Limnohabitans sp.]
MGFYFRRSVNLGPFRVNLSRGGVGWSVGGRGLRTGRSAQGRRYTTISIPGTGVGYRTGGARGCVLVLIALPAAVVVVIGSAVLFVSDWGIFV